MKKQVFSKIKLLTLLIAITTISISCGSDDSEPPVLMENDTDGDGVLDKDDTCPNDAGLVALSGCPDGDSDGVADKDDSCPDEAGLAELNGCPDADGDGTADVDDVCPNEAGAPDLDGCPADPDAEESTTTVGPIILRFNAGGGEVTIGDITFLEDQYFVGSTEGYTNPNVTEIANTDLEEIYLTERVSITRGDALPFSYEIPIENGTYTVKFHFAEIFWGVTNPQNIEGGINSRVFDMNLEEQDILNSFDIFRKAGGAAIAITRMYDIEVTDGVLNIDFLTSIDRPKVSAIEIFGNGTINP